MITEDWNRIGVAIRERDRDRCMNCHRTSDDATLDVHHVVPRGSSGSHRLSNLILLCRQCHNAIHNDEKAPRIQWYTNGEMDDDEFEIYRLLWNSLDLVRYDDEDECWYIPLADAEELVDFVQDTGKGTKDVVQSIAGINEKP